jgi:uncharacterized pyridoxamine 5'-phosphate oxidase family protein
MSRLREIGYNYNKRHDLIFQHRKENMITNKLNMSVKRSIEEVCDLLKQCEAYFLAIMEGHQSQVYPFSIVTIFDKKLYIQIRKHVAKPITTNQKNEFCAYDETKDLWLHIETLAIPDEHLATKQFIFDWHPSFKSMYSAIDSSTLVTYLKKHYCNISPTFRTTRVVKF